MSPASSCFLARTIGSTWKSNDRSSSCAIGAFDLADGKCTVPLYTNGTGRNGNRGREIGLFADEFIIQGGQPLHLDQPGERVERTACEMTYVRTRPDGQMAMPPVIPYYSNTALPVWDDDSLLTPQVVKRIPRVVCLDAAQLKGWVTALQIAREESFKKRKSWMPAVFNLTSRTTTKDGIASKRPAPVWQMEMKRGALVHALALTENAAVVAVCPKKESWQLIALDRARGTELWRHQLPAEPLFNGLCMNRDGRVFVTLTDGRIVCFGK